jgi:hypothetical protein
MLYDHNRIVVDYVRTEARLNRRSESDPWTARHARTLCQTLKDAAFRNGRNYAHKYDIFWGTPDSQSAALDPDGVRDQLGLVHIDRHEPVLQLTFRCSGTSHHGGAIPRHVSAPTVVEATSHRRFKARPPRIGGAATGGATAADLERLRVARTVVDGFEELVLSSIPMDALIDAHFKGFTGEHADISGSKPTRITVARDDRLYAKLLEPPVRLSGVVAALKAALE